MKKSPFLLEQQSLVKSVESWYNIAESLVDEVNKDEALYCCTQAIAANPLYYKAYALAGYISSNLGKKKQAIKYYDIALSINPNDAIVYNNKGNALSDLGKKKQAIKYYDIALSINPNDAIVYYNKGKALSDLGKAYEALEYFNQASKLLKSGHGVEELKTKDLETVVASMQELILENRVANDDLEKELVGNIGELQHSDSKYMS